VCAAGRDSNTEAREEDEESREKEKETSKQHGESTHVILVFFTCRGSCDTG
jgi:hypothetical protein